MPMPPAEKISPAVSAQAVQWLVELQASGYEPQRVQAWQQWRDADPQHARAWRRIEAINHSLRGLPAPLVQASLGQPSSPQRRHALKLLLLGAGSVAALGVGRGIDWQPLLADQSTAIGERRELTLADGSQLTLNSDSAVDIRFDAQQRLIQLRRGEIFLASQADPRPLRVSTPNGELLAGLGRFNVRMDAEQMQVQVLDGELQLQQPMLKPLLLQGGEQLGFTSDSRSPIRPAEPTSNAWTAGMLIASGMRLDRFIGELARYRHGHLSCAAEVAALQLSGTYPLDDSEQILALLPQTLPVQVQRLTRYWVRIQPLQAVS
ncbi:FecR family protein [Pseudomonas sp. LS44]|uniref:FecR domain-containing protein n=1 Tax=Pseudomonas sp. LS44 TaxID=1357074 RepID=UPI00215A6EC2|nr:FecR family protein [Pseudomonas sp. LS44]UVE16887.1 FecR family protein [Pseudomonas sp. LS44]